MSETKVPEAVAVAVEKKPKVGKRVKKDKFNNFTIPPRNTTSYSKSVKHIYDMINEAAPQLLGRDDVRNAFNTYVEFLKKYNDILVSWSNGVKYKYGSGVKITDENCVNWLNCRIAYSSDKWTPAFIKDVEARWLQYTNDKPKYTNDKPIFNVQAKIVIMDSHDIINAYKPLYDLIKRDVVPYMEIKDWEIKSKRSIEYLHSLIEKDEQIIKNIEESIKKYRKNMSDNAQKVLELRVRPQTTVFD